MSRGITLRGEAARGFMEAFAAKPVVQDGKEKRKELSEDDKYNAIASRVTLLMKSGGKKDAAAARLLLKELATEGLEKAFGLIVGR